MSLLREKYPHYHKACPFSHVDVYRVLTLFGVTDPCLQHAVKKLLVAGGRGAKDISRDVREAIETLIRWEEMRAEEKPTDPAATTTWTPEKATCSECKRRHKSVGGQLALVSGGARVTP